MCVIEGLDHLECVNRKRQVMDFYLMIVWSEFQGELGIA